MKRHKTLVGLSQDHQKGLLLAQVIKKGSPEFKTLPNNIKDQVKYTKEIWETDLKFHFENEENILFPKIKGRDYEIDLLIKEVLEDHRLIKGLIKKLDDDEGNESTLHKLGQLLNDHIRKEERVLFPKIEKHFETDLNEMPEIESVNNSSK
jgi:hemerythrin-like domain-containing protein